jgi:hypothetical protein
LANPITTVSHCATIGTEIYGQMSLEKLFYISRCMLLPHSKEKAQASNCKKSARNPKVIPDYVFVLARISLGMSTIADTSHCLPGGRLVEPIHYVV